MTAPTSEYRLDGIYSQRQDGYYMQRVKLAAGVVSAAQARTVAAVSTRFGRGTIHLTSRGSIEIHWLREEDLPQIKRELGKVGLTSRGACGGAVRGITCGAQGVQGFPELESMARRLQCHFTGNPRFEQLPKKFKIGIEENTNGGKHLIQDVGLVSAGKDDAVPLYDLWVAGGLGREPRAGFLLSQKVPEKRIITIIEAIIRVYAAHAPPPKRLKFLAKEFGEAKLRQLIEAETSFAEDIPAASGLPENITTAAEGCQRLELPLFAGRLTSMQLLLIADCAERVSDGVLIVTPNQDIALLLPPGVDADAELKALQQSASLVDAVPVAVMRVCPGNHECRMGLAATRDVAQELLAHIGTAGQSLTWALSGCPNSCSQPQLADVGIIAARIAADTDGEKTPRFDLYRKNGEVLGEKVHAGLMKAELFAILQRID